MHYLVLIHEPIEFYMGKSVNYVKLFAKTAEICRERRLVEVSEFSSILACTRAMFTSFRTARGLPAAEDHRQLLVAENSEPNGKLLER